MGFVRTTLSLDRPTVGLIDLLSDGLSVSKSMVVREAIRSYYSQVSLNPHVAVAKLDEIEERVELLSDKSELFYKLMLNIMTFVLSYIDVGESGRKNGEVIFADLIKGYVRDAGRLSFDDMIYGVRNGQEKGKAGRH